MDSRSLVWLWIKAVIRHWALLLGGSIATVIGWWWTIFGSGPIFPPALVLIGGPCTILGAFFLAWRDEFHGRETAVASLRAFEEERNRNIPIVLLDFHHSGGLMWLDEHAPTVQTDKGTVLNVLVHPINEEGCNISFPNIPSLGMTPISLSPIISWPEFKGAIQSASDYFAQALYNRCSKEPESREIPIVITYRLSNDVHAMTKWIISIRRHGQNLQVREVRHYQTSPLIPLNRS